jgi:hypothetical protein
MTHLTRDQLLAWRDAPSPASREMIIGHLAACDECAAIYAELIRIRSVEQPPERFDPRDFVEAGYAAARPPVPLVAFRPRLWVPLAAAAAVVLAVLLPLMRPATDAVVPTDTLRSGAVEALAPAGPTAGVIEFRWTSPAAADRYAVEVKDPAGQRIFYRETREAQLAGDAVLVAALQPGMRYTWTVTALDATGETLSQSPPREFTRVVAPSP